MQDRPTMLFTDAHTHHPHGALHVLNRLPLEGPPATGLFSVGLHPWHTDPENFAFQWEKLTQLIMHPRCVALGECGFDRLRGAATAWQQQVFELQLELAEASDKPLILHCVRGFDLLQASLKRLKNKPLCIWHGYNQKAEVAQWLLKQDFILSFGASLLQPNSQARKILPTLPPQSFLLETDDQTRVDLPEIYACAAKLRMQSTETLAQKVAANFAKTFQLP